ncbi:DMT family transporter [Phenylobacterium sp.]|jgi:drug/metabolite transporter (DMT)-like permease|uniref:DMT family transporter n=1 Tax=Phenylobacterium sp. TaxID=1871053 RepID=UPI000C891BFA|nr:DMT family transporter [Phenylobacterium sp.]MAK83834.1 multidrug transporter [Phenylobacterium sp.]|tara:strand:- start:54866 stop:55711 length:846 start_codon:yes stop_codon:yes gene_type:complete
MVASALGFTVMTTLIKFLGDDYPAALQTFYRQVAGFVILIPFIINRRGAAFATTRPGILLFRSAAGTLGMILSFYAFQKMPLADANALSFTRTLWLVPLAFFIVREPVGPMRIGAALVGFAGVLIMVRPGADGEFAIGWPAAAMLASSFLFALTITGMKVMTRDHSPMVLLVWSATLGLVFALPGALFVWRWPEPFDLFLLSVMGVVGTLTQGFYIKGMSIGDAGAMAPIDYIRLVFAAGAGFLLFNELPTIWTLMGAAVVVVSTLFITWREQQIARQARL